MDTTQPVKKNLRGLTIALIIIGTIIGLTVGYYIMMNSLTKAEPLLDDQMQMTSQTSTENQQQPMERHVLVNLAAQNDSSQSGTATLVERDGKITVTIDVTPNTTGVAQPAHIHLGRCPTPGAVKYPLTNVENGKSVTVLDINFDTLKEDLPLAININKSQDEAKVYTACGNVFSE